MVSEATRLLQKLGKRWPISCCLAVLRSDNVCFFEHIRETLVDVLSSRSTRLRCRIVEDLLNACAEKGYSDRLERMHRMILDVFTATT